MIFVQKFHARLNLDLLKWIRHISKCWPFFRYFGFQKVHDYFQNFQHQFHLNFSNSFWSQYFELVNHLFENRQNLDFSFSLDLVIKTVILPFKEKSMKFGFLQPQLFPLHIEKQFLHFDVWDQPNWKAPVCKIFHFATLLNVISMNNFHFHMIRVPNTNLLVMNFQTGLVPDFNFFILLNLSCS